jgi:hypothetical protein
MFCSFHIGQICTMKQSVTKALAKTRKHGSTRVFWLYLINIYSTRGLPTTWED